MAKISQLPIAEETDGTETLPIVQGGTTRRLTLDGFIRATIPRLQNWYKGDPGETGPANSTYTSLAKLKAAPSTSASYILATSAGPITYAFVVGNFTGRADDVNVVELAAVPLTTGALMRQGAASISDRFPASQAVTQSQADVNSETVSVLKFGATGLNNGNDTGAFDAAIATGKAVIVPSTVYQGVEIVRAKYFVENIAAVDRMHIRGEKTGWADAPLLVVRSSGAAAFLNSSEDILFYPMFENLACTAAPGVTGASFFKQSRMDIYTAYPTFNNVETYLDLAVSYIIAPIYAVWNRCRDGGEGSFVGTEHTAVSAIAASYGQRDQFNVVAFNDCVFNNAFGGQSAIVASYGSSWVFNNCGFESCQVSAFVGYNVEGVRFNKCWIEGIRAPNTIQLRNYTGTAASSSAVFESCRFVFNGSRGVAVQEVFGIDNLSTVALKHNEFHLVPDGVKVTNVGTRITVCEDNHAVSGSGAAHFFDGAHQDTYAGGRRLLQGAADNGVLGMTIQTADGVSAPLGFLSGSNIDVGTSFTTVASSQTGFGATVTVSGYDTSDGSKFRYFKNFLDEAIQDVTPPINNTTRTITFQSDGTALKMKTNGGMLKVFTTIEH